MKQTHCLALFLGFLFTLFALPPAAQAQPRFNPGDPVSFAATDIQGQRHTASQYTGRLVVVEFWAAWCGPCLAMVPEMNRLHNAYGQATDIHKAVAFLSINLDEDLAKGRAAAAKHDVLGTLFYDVQQEKPLAKLFFKEGFSIPHVFLIGPDGRLRWRGHPALLGRELEAAREGRPASEIDNSESPAGPSPFVLPTGVAGVDATALAARNALRHKPPSFARVLELAQDLPPTLLTEHTVRMCGRSIDRALEQINEPAQIASFKQARLNNPTGNAALTQWLNATRQSHWATPEKIATLRLAADNAAASNDSITAFDLYVDLAYTAPAGPDREHARRTLEKHTADAVFMDQRNVSKAQAVDLNP